MVISDLNYIEVVSESADVKGAFASSLALASAGAAGRFVAITRAATSTTSVSGFLVNIATAGSGSSSFAA